MQAGLRLRGLCWGISLGILTIWAGTASGAEEQPFDYFRNSWNVVGLRNYRDGARVTPENNILLAKRSMLAFRFGQNLTPLSRQQVKRAMDGWLPVMLVTAVDGPVHYDFKFWATPLPSVKDWRKAFDGPTEGENFLLWAVVTATNAGKEAAEARVAVERFGDGATPPREFSWQLAPAASAEAVVRVPFATIADAAAFDREDPKVWLQRAADYWKRLMASAAQIDVPCRKATDMLRAAHVCQLVASVHGEIHAGKGFYDEFFIRDGAYQIMELEEAGLSDIAAKAIESFLTHQRPDGRFESQTKQYDANGQAIWALWQYWKITGDRAWLERAYPQIRKATDWTAKARREAPDNSPYGGLLPPGVADGEYLWDGDHHIVGYDLWNLRGLLCAADAARALGNTGDADDLAKEATSYRAAIDAAQKRHGIAHFPPSWEGVGTHWGNTETLWPTKLFPDDDPRVVAMIDEARNHYCGGFVEGTIRRDGLGVPGQPDVDAILPYLSAYTTMADLVRGRDEQVVQDFYWYLLHSTAAHAFSEGIFYHRRMAWADTTPHATGASNCAVMLRHMLVHESGDELHLLPAVPDWWLGDGQSIRVDRAPTHFGEMSLLVQGSKNGVAVRFTPPRRNPPKKIVLHLPQSRPLSGTVDGVDVTVRPDQTKRWDFSTVVDAYLSSHPPAS